MKNFRNSPKISLLLCLGIVTICIILIIQFSGFRFEAKKLKQFAVTLIVVILSRYIVWEHVEFITKSALEICLPETGKTETEHSAREEKETHEFSYSPLNYLKLRLETSKAELNLTSRHKDERLNVEYLLLTKELWLFGKYFVLVLAIIVYSRSSYGYFNTKIMKSVLIENRRNNFGFRQMNTLNDLYSVLNDTFTHSLNEGVDYNGNRLQEPGWMDFEMAKLMGVVRLRQIRLKNKSAGMTSLQFDKQNYLPEWRCSNRTLYYIDKYWRTYYPWLSESFEGVVNWLVSFNRFDSLYTHTKSNAYVVLLARDGKNNEKILKFLKDHNWLDSLTAAVIIDFTLYNADANMFTIISILVEQTPFGGVIWQLDLQSVVLLTNLVQLSFGWCLLIVVYILQLIEFCKVMVIRYLYTPAYFQSPWNCVDIALVFLNAAIFILLATREYYIIHTMKSLEAAYKLDFIDFRVANFFDFMTTIALGFLVALTTMRLWKILQFCSVFRLFTRTLYKAAKDLLATVIGIYLFLFAFGFATQIVNGTQSEVFSSYLKSLTSIMSFSFGFDSHTNPADLAHGGRVFGFILYLILMFVVAIFLINMFITLICDHFAAAREERDKQPRDQLDYMEFLCMEYGDSIRTFCSNLIPLHFYRKRHLTVNEHIQENLDKLDEKYQDSKENFRAFKVMDDEMYEADALRADRIQKTVSILKLQMEILHREIMLTSLEWDSDEDDSDKGI